MENQIILIDKPTGISSFGVVAKVRRYLKAKFGHKIKVGHTGTLDPFATGLLILLTGQMTKKSNDFLKLDKTYEATLRFGYTSTTGDPEGKLEKISNIVPDINQIKNTINSVLGVINQKVPTFSAVKINGQRAYKLARAGKNFETPTRKITIHNI
jgi:tRNA pseudouridine55 synthase